MEFVGGGALGSAALAPARLPGGFPKVKIGFPKARDHHERTRS